MFHFDEEQKSESVGFAGDGDDSALIEDFEAIFEITISKEDAESIVTLREAYDVIRSKLPNKKEQQNKCRTAMAYYRLNRAFGDRRKANPALRLEVPAGKSPKGYQKQLEERSNLRLDFLTIASLWVSILAILQLVTWIAAPIMFSGFFAVLVGILIFAISHGLWRLADHFDKRVWIFDGTMGDLARQASEINFGKLVSLGGNWKEADVWKIMTSIIHGHTGFPADKMTPDMKFI